MWRLAAILDLLTTEASIQKKCHHRTQHGRKTPFRHITRSFKSVYMAVTHLPEFPSKLGPWATISGKWPPWGYFCTFVPINLVVIGTSGYHWNFAIIFAILLGDPSYLLDYIFISIWSLIIVISAVYDWALAALWHFFVHFRHVSSRPRCNNRG